VSKREKLLEKMEEAGGVIAIHRKKIEAEMAKPNPNFGRIEHWKREIEAQDGYITRKRRRLAALGRKK